MLVRRGAALWAVLAFVIGVAVGPFLGWERETVVVTNTTPQSELQWFAAEGWTVSRSDVARADLRLVTFERPRIVGLCESAGDLFNNAGGRLAWLTRTGEYARR